MTRLLTVATAIVGFLVAEFVRASANERSQRARGGLEPPGDVYPLMQVAYPGIFLLILGEGWLHRLSAAPWLAAGIGLFAAGKLLKWWAIVSLGPFWTFRVLVVPGTTRVRSGPYRYLRHPNYVAVAAELAGAAMMANAPVAGTLGTLFFTGLMVLRVRVENRMLDAILRRG